MINDLVKQFKLIESTISDMHYDKCNAMIIYDMIQYLQSYLRDVIIILKQYENKKFKRSDSPMFTIVHIKNTTFGLSFRIRNRTGLIEFLKYPTDLIEIKE